MLKQFALIMVSNSVGNKNANILPTWANWVKIRSFRAPCELICSASVDWTAQNGRQNRSLGGIKKHRNNCKNVENAVILKLPWEPTKKNGPRPGESKNCPERELSARHIFISYPWMAAKDFYLVTGQLKGHSHMFFWKMAMSNI